VTRDNIGKELESVYVIIRLYSTLD